LLELLLPPPLPPLPLPDPLVAFNKLGRNGGVGRRQLMVQLAED